MWMVVVDWYWNCWFVFGVGCLFFFHWFVERLDQC